MTNGKTVNSEDKANKIVVSPVEQIEVSVSPEGEKRYKVVNPTDDTYKKLYEDLKVKYKELQEKNRFLSLKYDSLLAMYHKKI